MAQSPKARSFRIDVHNHYYPERYFQKIRDTASSEYSFDTDASGTTIIRFRGARFFGIQPPMTRPALRLEEMDRVGVDVEVLSLSTPNVYFATEELEAEIARMANDEYAELIAKHPKRFKGFASVPMSLPDKAIEELHRALDELHLNGVILLSNIRGKPLTSREFRPFFEEANRMRLCMILHPMVPAQSGDPYRQYVLGPIIGFPCETTLAVARMCYDGMFRDFPDIRWILPHLGGAIPFLMERMDKGFHDFVACREKIQEPPSTYLKTLFYGTVSSNAYTLSLVRDLFGSDHIALGSDFPHLLGSMEGAVETLEGLLIPRHEKEQIESGTALSILNNVQKE